MSDPQKYSFINNPNSQKYELISDLNPQNLEKYEVIHDPNPSDPQNTQNSPDSQKQ